MALIGNSDSVKSSSWMEYGSSYLASPSQMASNLTKIAFPVVLAVGATYFSGAEAGPVTYASCVLGCELLATAGSGGIASIPALQMCINGCMPSLGPWCP